MQAHAGRVYGEIGKRLNARIYPVFAVEISDENMIGEMTTERNVVEIHSAEFGIFGLSQADCIFHDIVLGKSMYFYAKNQENR